MTKNSASISNSGNKDFNGVIMKIFKIIVISFIALYGSGCTEPGETTEVAAATGSVIGAGLGAIVGSQTGDAGAGLVIGAAAGAGTGALIGNSIQAQEETLRTQDEAIERQEKVIAAQRSELNELRKMNQDAPSFKTRLSNSLDASDGRASYRPRIEPQPLLQEKSLQPELPVQPQIQQNTSQKGYSASLYDNAPPKTAEVKIAPVKLADEKIESSDVTDESVSSPTTTECAQAEQEIGKAKISSDNSDKLFHTRRAIRLCSDRPSYHQTLGEVYMSLNRKDDALFEFQEALKYDPSYGPAKESVAKLSGSAANNFPNTNKY
jgi:osmotically inducible lipoprotein OsmB